jgi:phosphatidylglycerol:prolipoprotein diacylglycerol transferase
MSFHGGLLGVILAILVFSRRHRLPLGGVADAIALASPPAILLGRIANFINAELWGRPTTLPWGVIFPGEAAQDCPGVLGPCARHPSQLYEAGLEGLLLGLLLILLAFRWGALRRPWLLTGVFLAGYGAARFLVEFVRQPDAQFVTPGNPLGLVLHIDGWGLTMGQVLTLPMILAGVLIVLRARRRTPAPA